MKLPEVSVNGAIGSSTSATSSRVSLSYAVNANTLPACFRLSTALPPPNTSASGSTFSNSTAFFGWATKSAIATWLKPSTSAPTLLAACGKMPKRVPNANAAFCAAW